MRPLCTVHPDLGPEDAQDPGGLRAAGRGGRGGAGLPGKQACLHVFPERLLGARPWGHTEKMVGRSMLHGLPHGQGLMLDTRSLPEAHSHFGKR